MNICSSSGGPFGKRQGEKDIMKNHGGEQDQEKTERRPQIGATRRVLLAGAVSGAAGAMCTTAFRTFSGRNESASEHSVISPFTGLADHVALHIVGGSDIDSVTAHENVLKIWQETPGVPDQIDTNFEGLGGDSNAQLESVLPKLKGPESPDLIIVDPEYLPLLASQRLITPFTNTDRGTLINSGCFNRIIERCYFDHKLHAIPIHADAPVLAINKSYLKKEHRAAVKQLRSQASPNNFWLKVFEMASSTEFPPENKIKFETSDYEGLTTCLIELIFAFGGVVHEDTTLKEEKTRQAIGSLRKSLKNYDLGQAFQNPAIGMSGTASCKEEDVMRALENDETAFARLWPAHRTDLTKNLDQIEWIPIPGGTLGGQVMALSKRSKEPRLSEELARYLCSPLSQLALLYHGGYVPSLKQLHSDKKMADFDSLKEAMEVGALRPQTSRYNEWSRDFRSSVRNYLLGNGEELGAITDALSKYERV
ncbi:MAG: multiple sugar transport system substrate-binding protein [Actinomycetota bacterium]|nr:multiple sugar transport system substrate-binding protein [Actinomycetota bacterium]